METQNFTARGIVREGLVVPLGDEELPEGAEVKIRVVALAVNLDSVSEALTDAERWRRFSEESGASINWEVE